LLRDIRGGVVGTIPAAIAFLRKARETYDRIVVVGDLTMILGCRMAGLTGVTYLDVYRSGFERGYWTIEKQLIRATCGKVFCRSEPLAASLRTKGIDATAAGNVMMDTIPRGDYDARSRRTRPLALMLLPGSRDTTIDNFRIQALALRRLPAALRPDLFLSLSAGVDPDTLASIAGLSFVPPATRETADGGTLTGDLTVHLSRDVLGNLLDVADVAMSQAGTATIQTIGSGVPAITFRARRNRHARIKGISALYADARILVDAEPEPAADALTLLLGDDHERKRRSAIGRERIGPPGASAAIIAELSR
ncbi:MAG: hypothetical protein ABL879_16910, partial [Devosia sp.]